LPCVQSPNAWNDFSEIKEGTLYKIKNCHSEMSSIVGETYVGKGTATMEAEVDDQNQYASHRLWYLVKKDGYYKIKNCHSGNVLNSWGACVGRGTALWSGS